MTRINCGIPPKSLGRQHLLSEHRELIRIPNAIRNNRAVIKNIPAQFTLGRGHVKFFYNKLGYLKDRYELLYAECVKRGYNVQYYGSTFDGIPEMLMGSYIPTLRDKMLITARIKERLKNM